MSLGFTADRREVLDGLYRMGAGCCAYSMAGVWSAHCDCKYGVTEVQHWPTMHESGNGCPELRSLHGVIKAMTDDEWTRLVRRAGGTPTSVLGGDDLAARLHRAEVAMATAEVAIAKARAELAEPGTTAS